MTHTFVQLSGFVADWRRLRLRDAELLSLEAALLRNPLAGPVMKDTGGCRKVRHAPPGRGKSGSVRVVYILFPLDGWIVLAMAYGKHEQAELSDDDKKALRAVVKRIDAALAKTRQKTEDRP